MTEKPGICSAADETKAFEPTATDEGARRPGSAPHDQAPVAPRHREDAAQAEQGKLGWVSPAYRVSRAVRLQAGLVRENRLVAFDDAAPEADSYRILRAQIIRRCQTGGNSIMITSAVSGEGKTVTAVNLAMSFAREFSRTVLLVDCDLRRPKIHELLGYPDAKGLAHYLLDGAALSDLIVCPGLEKLTVISGGRPIPGSSELFGSPGMRALVQELKNRYQDRLVIFDVPPVLAGADALALAPLVDQIVMVVRAGHTSGKDVQKALGLLPQEKLLGLVLNRGVTFPAFGCGGPEPAPGPKKRTGA